MKYTIQRGVNHPFSERFSSNSKYILPLLVVLVGLLFFVINPYHNTKKPSPLTLGIYTVKSNTPKQGGSDNNGSTGGNGSDLNGSGQNANVNPQLGVVAPLGGGSAPAGATSPSSAIGGMGGGLPSGTGGSGGGGTGGSGTVPPAVTTTVTCDNTGGILPYTCTACTPALIVPVGQKVLLSSTGSCSLIN